MSVWAIFSVLWCWRWRCSSWIRVEWIETVIADCIILSRIAHRNVSGPSHSFRCSGLAGRGFTAGAGALVCRLRGHVRHCALILLSYLCCAELYPHINPRRESEKEREKDISFSL